MTAPIGQPPASPPVVPSQRVLAGHNRISAQAMGSIARAAAAETLGCEPGDVRVTFSDDGGLLALGLALPVGIPPLAEVIRDSQRVASAGGSVLDRVIAAKGIVGDRVSWLTGSLLSRIDIRVTGARPLASGRVK